MSLQPYKMKSLRDKIAEEAVVKAPTKKKVVKKAAKKVAKKKK